MKKIIALFLITLTNLSFASDLTLVAVGEAELEREKVVVRDAYLDGQFTVAELKKINELIKVIRNDFSFYKKTYEVLKVGKNPLTEFEKLDFADLNRKAVRHLLRVEFTRVENKVNFQFQAFDVAKKSLTYGRIGEFNTKNVRALAHELSDGVYQKLNARPSIFLSKIAFASDVYSRSKKDKHTELFIMDFDGFNVKRLTRHGGYVFSPAFSKDNTKILYTLIKSGVSKRKNVNLRMINLKTGKDTLISKRTGINSGAVFMPDGNSIALTLSHTGNSEIFVMNLMDKSLKRLTKHYSPDVDPSISYDGKLMTFLSGRPGKPMIYTKDPSGTEKSVKRISYVGKYNATPRFSPDGKEIVFSSWLDQRFDLFRINADGSGLSRLTKDFGSNEDPSYSNDGQFIAFSSQRVISQKKAVQNIYIMDREGEILGNITRKFGNCITPRWSN